MNFSLPSFALKRPVTVVMVALCMATLGTIAWFSMPLNFLPPFDPPFIGISIPFPGASPTQVEQQIAIPAEGEFRTVSGLRRVRTISDSNGCFVSLQFHIDTDMRLAMAEVRDRIERLKLVLPSEADRMLIQRFSSRSLPIMAIGVFSPGDQEEFIHLVRNNLEPRLRRLDGVADVELMTPIQEREVLVEFDQATLRGLNLGLAEVIAMLQESSLNISIGQLSETSTRYFVRALGEYRSIDDIASLIVAPTGLRLHEVATVRYSTPEEIAHVALDASPGAFILVVKESEANTVATCRAVREELDAIIAQPFFADTTPRIFFDQSELILTALRNLLMEGVYGGAMALTVLFLFLHRVRPTVIVALTIPTSLVVALVFMFFAGMSLNIVTMVSMIIVIGMLVDNSIVVVENIIRHRQLGHDPVEAARRGASEVGLAIFTATSTTWVVFIPMYFMEAGQMAVFMEQLGLPLIVALGGSLMIALTLIPLVMSRMSEYKEGNLFQRLDKRLGRKRGDRADSGRGGLVAWLGRFNPFERILTVYARILRISLRWRIATLACIGLIVYVTLVIPLPAVGMRELPKLDTREIKINVDLDQNYDFMMTRELFALLEEQIDKQREELAIKNVLSFYEVGGGFLDVYLYTAEDGSIGRWPPYNTEQVMRILSARLGELAPGAEMRFSVAEATDGGGGERGVRVRVRGDDKDMLEEYANRFADIMAGLPNVSEVSTDIERSAQEMQLRIDSPLAARAGVSSVAIAQTVDAALRGARLPFMKHGGREVPVWAQFREEDRQTRGNLENVDVMSQTTRDLVPLNQLVSFHRAQSPSAIQRVDGKNVINVTAQADTDDLAGISRDLRRAIANFEMPVGYSIGLGDELLELGENIVNFTTTLIMAIILIYLVMSALFESYLLPLSILTSVPMALGGGIWMLYFTGTELDTVTFIGCVLMSGLIVNNGIVVVDQINRLAKRTPDRLEAIVEAGCNRFRPVMMTAITTILGVVPLALAQTGGAATFAGLGRALIGGLTAGTLLTLVVVPLFYTLIDDFQRWCVNYFGGLGSLRRTGAARPAGQ